MKIITIDLSIEYKIMIMFFIGFILNLIIERFICNRCDLIEGDSKMFKSLKDSLKKVKKATKIAFGKGSGSIRFAVESAANAVVTGDTSGLEKVGGNLVSTIVGALNAERELIIAAGEDIVKIAKVISDAVSNAMIQLGNNVKEAITAVIALTEEIMDRAKVISQLIINSIEETAKNNLKALKDAGKAVGKFALEHLDEIATAVEVVGLIGSMLVVGPALIGPAMAAMAAAEGATVSVVLAAGVTAAAEAGTVAILDAAAAELIGTPVSKMFIEKGIKQGLITIGKKVAKNEIKDKLLEKTVAVVAGVVVADDIAAGAAGDDIATGDDIAAGAAVAATADIKKNDKRPNTGKTIPPPVAIHTNDIPQSIPVN